VGRKKKKRKKIRGQPKKAIKKKKKFQKLITRSCDPEVWRVPGTHHTKSDWISAKGNLKKKEKKTEKKFQKTQRGGPRKKKKVFKKVSIWEKKRIETTRGETGKALGEGRNKKTVMKEKKGAG